MLTTDNAPADFGNVLFHRRVLRDPPNWSQSKALFTDTAVDAKGMIL